MCLLVLWLPVSKNQGNCSGPKTLTARKWFFSLHCLLGLKLRASKRVENVFPCVYSLSKISYSEENAFPCVLSACPKTPWCLQLWWWVWQRGKCFFFACLPVLKLLVAVGKKLYIHCFKQSNLNIHHSLSPLEKNYIFTISSSPIQTYTTMCVRAFRKKLFGNIRI